MVHGIYSSWYMNMRILQNMISGIPVVLGLGTRESDPYAYVFFWAPTNIVHTKARRWEPLYCPSAYSIEH